jgi:hypothetical protein
MELKIKKETAKKIYADAPNSLKEILAETFGKECFEKIEFTDITSFDDACAVLDLEPSEVYHEDDLPDEKAYMKLKVIIKAINQGWTPDWNNTNQYKWFPYFNLSSGFGFAGTTYNCVSTATAVGSRLCFETEEKAQYAGKQFLNLYKEFLNLTY